MDRYGEALPALYDAIELEERRAQETGVPRLIGYTGYQGKLEKGFLNKGRERRSGRMGGMASAVHAGKKKAPFKLSKTHSVDFDLMVRLRSPGPFCSLIWLLLC